MLIRDEDLRVKLRMILLTKTRNKIVTEIKSKDKKFHSFQINKFLSGCDVSLSTLKKIDEYVNK